MIDPKKVTKYNRNKTQLQEFLLYCICVAGKKSEIETRKLDKFLRDARFGFCISPFDFIKKLMGVASCEHNGLMQHLLKSVMSQGSSKESSPNSMLQFVKIAFMVFKCL